MEHLEGFHNRKKDNPKRSARGKRLLGFALFLIILLAGAGLFCKWAGIGPFEKGLEHPEVTDSRSESQSRADFDKFLQEIFVEEITSDSITTNYLLKNPENYGLADLEPSLGSYSLSDLQDGIIVSENRLATLETYDYDKLTSEQQLIYDILYQMLQWNLEASDLLEYSECLGPTSGIQAQLPILLAEYNFFEQNDIETYLELLNQVPEYFEDILAFEEMKSREKLFMSDTTAQAIINQCEEFIASPEENYLITVFEQKLASFDGTLSEKKKKQYIEENETAVLEKVIPAYENLIAGLEELKGTGVNTGGLCHFEKGKEYYTYLLKAMTGSERSPESVDKLLEKTLKESQKKMAQIMSDSPDTYYDAQKVQYPYSEPGEAIDWLKEQILADFPALSEDIQCEVKYVDESLEQSLSPAFYLTSPIDAYTQNVIYINQNEEYDLTQSFPTIGHESYPGHLYQHCYFQETKPHPVRNIINIGGYSEGWGTYAELYSYHIAGLDENVADLLEQNTIATLCIYARADLLVNYKGWSYQKLEAYLEDFGFNSTQSKIIFDSMVAEPVSYMQYTLGYLEIEELLDTARSRLGNRFSLKDFHEFYLSVGTAPFSVLQDRLETWINSR